MSEIICSNCGKSLTKDEIGFVDKEKNLTFCRSCAINKIDEKVPTEQEEVIKKKKEKKQKAFVITVVIIGIVIVVELLMLFIPKLFNLTKDQKPLREVIGFIPNEVEDPIGKLINLNNYILVYWDENNEYPDNINQIDPEALKDSEFLENIIYKKDDKFEYLLYRIDSNDEVLEPIFSFFGPINVEMMESGFIMVP